MAGFLKKSFHFSDQNAKNIQRSFFRAFFAVLLLTGFRASFSQVDAKQAIIELEQREDFIRVRLSKNILVVELQGKNLEFQNQPAEASPLTKQSEAPFRISYDQVEGKSVWIIQQGGDSRMVTGSGLFVKGSEIKLNGEPVPERLVIWPSTDNATAKKMNVLAAVQIEDYVAGVLPGEMSIKWPIEALKAQAVAIRTYALYRQSQRSLPRLKFAGENLKKEDFTFDVEASYLDQVFHTHLRARQKSAAKNLEAAKLLEVIDQTKGMVLLTKQGKIGPAYFHADCGGVTESADVIWNGKTEKKGSPFFKPVRDESCSLRAASDWKLKLTKINLLKKLKKDVHLQSEFAAEGLKIENVELLDSSPGEHVLSLSIQLSQKKKPMASVVVSGEALRAALGYSQLRSTHFILETTDNKIEFIGRGFGHGVGLCQMGARDWAAKGWTADKILSHYYPAFHLNREGAPARTLAHAEDDSEAVNPERIKL